MVESDDNNCVGRVPPAGDCACPRDVGDDESRSAGSGDPAYKDPPDDVGRVPSRGAANVLPPGGARPDEPPPRRLRRLHRVWPDREGNISWLLTLCVAGRARVLDNERMFARLAAFLLDSPGRYGWFPRRFVVMPDHLHIIAHQGYEAVRLGQWIKALKAVVGGLERRAEERRVGAPGLQGDRETGRPVGAPGLQEDGETGRPVRAPGLQGDRETGRPVGAPGLQEDGGTARPGGTTGRQGDAAVGRVPPRGEGHEFTRAQKSWHWQAGFHGHKLRTPESEQRKWEYVCLNPVRYGLVARPEEWKFGGEIFHDPSEGPRLVRGTPPLLEIGLLIEEGPGTTPGGGAGSARGAPGGGTGPTGEARGEGTGRTG